MVYLHKTLHKNRHSIVRVVCTGEISALALFKEDRLDPEQGSWSTCIKLGAARHAAPFLKPLPHISKRTACLYYAHTYLLYRLHIFSVIHGQQLTSCTAWILSLYITGGSSTFRIHQVYHFYILY